MVFIENTAHRVIIMGKGALGGFALQENTEISTVPKREEISHIYDKILKRILMLSSIAVINLINGLFKTNFPLDSKMVYNWTEGIDDDLGKTISDTILTIHANGEVYRFHIEIESAYRHTNDFSIVLRVFDYGYRDALKYRETGRDKIKLKFPKPKIILLDNNSNSPNEVTLELDFGDSGTINFTVPTLKVLDYNIDELNAQRMGTLLPLYLLKLRQQIEKAVAQGKDVDAMRKNAQALKNLINDGILKGITEYEKAGNIDSYDAYVLAGLVKKLYNHLYGDIKEFEDEGVRSALDNMLLVEYEAEILTARLNDKLEIAANLLGMGMSPADVAKATQLPLSRVEKLQNELVPA